MSNLYWLTNKQMARREPYFPKSPIPWLAAARAQPFAWANQAQDGSKPVLRRRPDDATAIAWEKQRLQDSPISDLPEPSVPPWTLRKLRNRHDRYDP